MEEFGIGFPPRAYGKKIGETIYSINWIPFGGFVRVLGEDPGQKESSHPKAFDNKPPRKKAAILLAGVTINIIIAIILFYVLLGFNNFQTFQGQIPGFDYNFPLGRQSTFPVVAVVEPGSPAEEAGIEEFDLILSGNGVELQGAESLISFLKNNAGQEVELSTKNIHTREEKTATFVPRKDPPEGQGAAGIGLGEVSRLSYDKTSEKVFSGFLHSYNMSHLTFSALGHFISTSIAERDMEIISEQVSGPVGILAFTKLTLGAGAWQLLTLVAILSLALAIMNLLPIPAVDGGRIIFVLYEAVFKRRVPAKLERGVNLVGFYLLLVLLVLITFKDIRQWKEVLF